MAVIAAIAAAAIPAVIGAVSGDGGGGGGDVFGSLGRLAGGAISGGGGVRQDVNQSQSTSVTLTSSPTTAVVLGAGSATPTASGGSNGTASAPVSAQQPGDTFGLPANWGASSARVAQPVRTNDLSTTAGPSLAGIFNDPMVLIALAALAAFLIFGKK